MTEAIWLLVILLYAASFVSPWFWLSSGITLLHTADEIASDGGPIWDYLSHLSRIPALVLAPGYLVFQAGVVALSWCAYGSESAVWLVTLAGVRLVDVTFTHNILRKFASPNPGFITSWLLLADVIVAAFLVLGA